MQLHTKSPLKGPGIYPIVQRGKQLKHLSFQVLQLGSSFKTWQTESGEEELAVDFYSGPVRVEVRSPSGDLTVETKPRKSVKDVGEMLYVPAGSSVKFTLLDGDARISLSGALGKPGVAPSFVTGGQVMTKQVGHGSFERTVHTHIADNIPARHLIVGETVNSPGSWSSCPPHKHDTHNPPSEVPMEEVYFFQPEPKEGFGFMRVYTAAGDKDPFDLSFAVEDGDTVIIPRGYHPVVAFPGYTLNYTWALAGEGRTYGAWSDDPKYSWIKSL
jgi:5-deoxy-glucuronate isomerase